MSIEKFLGIDQSPYKIHCGLIPLYAGGFKIILHGCPLIFGGKTRQHIQIDHINQPAVISARRSDQALQTVTFLDLILDMC